MIGGMRAATRKGTDGHRDEMAARAARRDLRRRRMIGTLVTRARAREMSRMLTEQLLGELQPPEDDASSAVS
jgi:hypothetical protein